MTIPFAPVIANLPATTPFVGPEELERRRGAPFQLRIGANESAFGQSPAGMAAMRDALATSAWYADPTSHNLRHALAARHGVTAEEIVVDAGIDTLLGLTVRLFCAPGTPVVTSLGAYPTFNYHVNGYGAVLHTVPYAGFYEDPDALLAEAHEVGARLIYLANPDNPMGTCHGAEAIQRLIDNLPADCLLVLDEAYIEFAPAGLAATLDTDNPQVLRFRTFSKAYGMAGQRIGYCIANAEIIAAFEKVRNHFDLNRVAQAGATASVDDDAFLAGVRDAVEAARQQVYALAQTLDLHAEPSFTNFVALDVGGTDRALTLLERLAARGVFMRMPGVAPLNRCVRVGLAQPDDMALA
ncbi:MAG: aminotransferase class I/II-fold pyridoxal phosphate-dependent enzyme, partial [Pseudomonadota bacterium]